jgi:starch phosphorylase
MATLTPEFSAERAIREYTESHYIPAASNYRERAAKDSALGSDLLQWHQQISQHWNSVRFGEMSVETHDALHFFSVQVFYGDMNPKDLKVELYANTIDGDKYAPVTMFVCEDCPTNDVHARIYRVQVSIDRPASDYTPRIIPQHAGAAVPLEAEQILWQH